MKAECYVLDIYCDRTPCAAFGHSEREQYTGENQREARKKARDDGWTIGKIDVCASCKNKDSE